MEGKKKIVVLIAIAVLCATAIYEGHYSSDMQNHIRRVNLDLADAQTRALDSSGLIGTLNSLTDTTDVAGEIIDTHDYVHTVRDEMLAWKIKRAVGESDTLGQAMYAVVAYWRENVPN